MISIDTIRVAGAGAAVTFALMTVAWAASVRTRNAGIADRAWGLALALLGWVYVLAGAGDQRAVLAAVLVAVWGVRLSTYLWWRQHGQPEEWRYAEQRHRGPASFPTSSLFSVFWLQALAAGAVGLPLLAAARDHQAPLGWLDALGAAVWFAGFGCETIADLQLTRFRRNAPLRADGILDQGLWRYTRHPNYFGDALAWWGIGLIGLAAGPWWSLLGPLGMTIVLLRVTGVAAMDRHLIETRGAGYTDYTDRTSAFLPRPPRQPATITQ